MIKNLIINIVLKVLRLIGSMFLYFGHYKYWNEICFLKYKLINYQYPQSKEAW